jgi:hypothetical protein
MAPYINPRRLVVRRIYTGSTVQGTGLKMLIKRGIIDQNHRETSKRNWYIVR